MEATVGGTEASPPRSNLEREYARALGNYVLSGGEAPLEEAYELGRQALTSGDGVLAMVHRYQDALEAMLRDHAAWSPLAESLKKAGEFFAESMSPFEMTHRAIGDANTALRKLNETLEDEVQRIALALHDDAGQLMVAVHLSLDEAMREMPPDAQERVSGVKALLGAVEERIRDLSHELRPAMLDHLGLVPAVEFLAANFGQRTGLHITVDSSLDTSLPSTFAITFYRIVQEALTNVRRHAHATEVRIHFSRRGNWIRCQVTDNGVGFDPLAVVNSGKPGLGLVGIRERLSAVGGKLRIQSAEGRGTKLDITAPLHQVSNADSDTPRRRSSRGT
jgi:signal transduction histidine kinase